MNRAKFYIVSLDPAGGSVSLEEIIQVSKDEYQSDGHEEFSLNEEEVDKILGDEAFCGGDLTEELMAKLESEATKSYKFYFTGLHGDKQSDGFCQWLKSVGIKEYKKEIQEDQDWNESWKVHYKPISLDKFIVLPVWDADTEVEKNKEKIIINPGMGFGTGTHETTRQCMLSLLDEVALGKKFKTCLDLGSGSGILGIAFQKICKGSVDFVDIDERAIENNKNNSDLNFSKEKVESNYYLREKYSVNKEYDLVFANILEPVLLEEYELIESAVGSAKTLIVSGILKEQKETIVNKYSKSFNLTSEKSEGDWMALTFIKK